MLRNFWFCRWPFSGAGTMMFCSGICDRNSVCPSVCRSVTLSWTVSTWFDLISSPYGSPIILVSGDIKFIPKFEGDHPERGR